MAGVTIRGESDGEAEKNTEGLGFLDNSIGIANAKLDFKLKFAKREIRDDKNPQQFPVHLTISYA